MWLSFITALLVSYLLGNLNGAVCVSQMMNDDVRSHGSGNAGLTNFIRNYGVSRAAYVVLVDAGKAVLACLVSSLLLAPWGYGREGSVLGGVAVMLGHVFPALLGFRGGKGILSGLFVALSVDWRIALIILVVFFVVYIISGYVSLGSILAATAFSVCFVVFFNENLYMMIGGVFMGALSVFMHRSNISRLLKGKEMKTSLFKKGSK